SWWYLILNAIILSLELESPDLILIRAIFVGLALGLELDAPAARDHLAAHLAGFGCAESHVRKVCVFYRPFFDVGGLDVQAFGQIAAGVFDCVVFIVCHYESKRTPGVLCSGDQRLYFEPKDSLTQRRNVAMRIRQFVPLFASLRRCVKYSPLT